MDRNSKDDVTPVMTKPLRPANSRRFQFETISLTLIVCFILAYPSGSAVGCYQDDPFGNLGAESGAAADGGNGNPPSSPFDQDNASAGNTILPQPKIDASLSDSTLLILRAIESSNPQTPAELARVMRTLVDIRSYDHALYYLSRLQAAASNEAALFEVHEILGTDFFLDLHANELMQPRGRQFARAALQAAKNYATSSERLNQLITSLSSEDGSVRGASFRQLRRLGPHAAAELIHVFADPARESEYVYVRAALVSMGDDAIPPLLAAARATNAQVQSEAIRALANFRSSDGIDIMMRTYLSPQVPDSMRQFALKVLMTDQQSPPSPAVVEESFYQSAQEYLLGQRKISGGLTGTTMLWSWNGATQQLESQQVSTATAQRIAAAMRAEDLYEINPESPRNRALYLLTWLESSKRIVGVDARVDSQHLQTRFDGINANEIEATLKQAIKLNLIPAATACCEVLGEIGSANLLTGDSHHPCPLVQAILIGDRHLQFAAFEAITRLDATKAYQGSSYVLNLAVYLAGSSGRASGLVGNLRSDLAQSFAAAMQAAGLKGVAVTSSRDFFHEATQNPDLDVLMVADTLDKPDYAELIQQLRNDMRTKRLPIALLFRDSSSRSRVQRLVSNDPFFIALPLTMDPEYVAGHVRRMRELAEPWPVTELDRRHHSQVAVEWLAKISNRREEYAFYNLGTHQDQLTRLLYLPGLVTPASDILKRLGTPAAQRELLNFANQSSLPIEERVAVASAFSEAVKSRGTMLTQDEIRRQYDRYNASETETVETQRVLGSILDVIERRSLEN